MGEEGMGGGGGGVWKNFTYIEEWSKNFDRFWRGYENMYLKFNYPPSPSSNYFYDGPLKDIYTYGYADWKLT